MAQDREDSLIAALEEAVRELARLREKLEERGLIESPPTPARPSRSQPPDDAHEKP